MAKGNGDYHHFPNGQGLDTRRFVLPAGTYLGRRESFALAPVSEQGIAIGYHGHLRLNEWLVEMDIAPERAYQEFDMRYAVRVFLPDTTDAGVPLATIIERQQVALQISARFSEAAQRQLRDMQIPPEDALRCATSGTIVGRARGIAHGRSPRDVVVRRLPENDAPSVGGVMVASRPGKNEQVFWVGIDATPSSKGANKVAQILLQKGFG